jgi:hypothetical protein
MDRVYRIWNKKGTSLRGSCGNASQNPRYAGRIAGLERQVEREWWWLHGAIGAVAQLQAERSIGNVKASAKCRLRHALSIGAVCKLRSAAELAARRGAG